jgi:hypothetical protein
VAYGGGQHFHVWYLGHAGWCGAMIGAMGSVAGSGAVAGGVAGPGAGAPLGGSRTWLRTRLPHNTGSGMGFSAQSRSKIIKPAGRSSYLLAVPRWAVIV